MQEQFASLRILQLLDDQLRNLLGEQKRLPLRLQGPEQQLQQAQKKLVTIREGIEQSERQQRAYERELELSQSALVKMEGKLREVKTNKEYSAALAEIATGKERLGALEDRLLQAMETIEQQRQELYLQEQIIRQAEHDVQDCQQAIQQAHAALSLEIATLQQQRQHTVVSLPQQLLETYEKVAAQHGGRAVVQLSNGACGGCHLKVQPQLISEIRQQTTLHTCPHCRLLLLWPA